MSTNWKFLSYEMNDSLSGYGNGKRIEIQLTNSIKEGKTSNNTELAFPSHYGTHIDFPFHFVADGKTGSDYKASDFVFKSIAIVETEADKVEDYLIKANCFDIKSLPAETDFLILKTGFVNKRMSDDYWQNNFGLAPELAADLKAQCPSIKAVGFDLISLSSYQQRPTGRIAHRKFLSENDILIVEDMELSEIDKDTQIQQLIVSPLRFKDADGTPVTVMAEINSI